MNNAKNASKICYIDLAEGELMHWKYIKRVKLPNGKYRYYYDADSLKNDARNAIGINQKKAYENASAYEQRVLFRKGAAISNAGESARALANKNHYAYESGAKHDTHAKNMRKLNKYVNEYASAKALEDKAYNNYIGTPLSFFTNPSAAIKKTINTGKDIVKKISRNSLNSF